MDQQKFGRNYILQVQKTDGTYLTVTLPFTIEFDITYNTFTSSCATQIRIYNLSLHNRNQIRHDVINFGLPIQQVILRAGYGQNMPVIFSGNITQAYSVREGVNMITQIECFDGGFAWVNGKTDVSFPAGTPNQTVISTMASSLPFVSLGAVGAYPGALSRGNSYSGSTVQILNDLTGGGFFVANGKANALGTYEYIDATGGIIEISSASGLLGTPVLEQFTVRFDMIFEPALFCGRSVFLNSITNNNFNGRYKISAVKHRGMISAAVCGAVITTGEFQYGANLEGVPSAS